MVRFTVIIAILISFQTTSLAQELMAIDNYLDKLRIENVLTLPNQISYDDINGTPYYDEYFKKGILHMRSGRMLSGEFRYDIYADAIEFKKDDKIYALSIPDSITMLEIESTILRYLPYYVKSEVRKSYFVVLEDGYYSLLEQRIKVFRKAELPRPYQDAPVAARFEDAGTEIYLKRGEEPAVNVSNIRDIIAVFSKEEAIAKEYINKHNIKFRDKDGIIKLINHMNQNVNR
jgi:hypothetical protein